MGASAVMLTGWEQAAALKPHRPDPAYGEKRLQPAPDSTGTGQPAAPSGWTSALPSPHQPGRSHCQAFKRHAGVLE